MLKSIMVGLDGSEYADAAMELAFRWARRFRALLVGIGIVDEPDICRPQMVPIGGATFKEHADKKRLESARQQVSRFLDEFADKCIAAGVAARLLEEVGLPYEEIVVESERCDLIMLGQHTFFEFATQSEPDETLSEVLKRTTRPVVVVPKTIPDSKSVVIAYDGSVQASRTLFALAHTGLLHRGPVHVVYAGESSDDAKTTVNRAVDFLEAHGVDAEAHLVDARPSIAEALLKAAEDYDAGLLAMGSYGQPALVEFFVGSVTKQLLRETKVPLFVYH